MLRRLFAVGLVGVAAIAGTSGYLAAYPGGTPTIVTNAAPYCATCHSSVNTDQLREQKPDKAAMLTIEKRHFGEIQGAQEGYAALGDDGRAKLIEQIKAIDSNSNVSVALSAASVKRGAPVTVTVSTHGGGGPVIGVMLLDTDLRFQSSPIQTEGFLITAPPAVTGPDGKPQTAFIDGRASELTKNVNYVNIQGVSSDPVKGTYPDCKVVYTLKAPADAGTYTVTAAFLYGTEKASPLGRHESPDGRVFPVGGGGAHSGRIAFAKVQKLTVN